MTQFFPFYPGRPKVKPRQWAPISTMKHSSWDWFENKLGVVPPVCYLPFIEGSGIPQNFGTAHGLVPKITGLAEFPDWYKDQNNDGYGFLSTGLGLPIGHNSAAPTALKFSNNDPITIFINTNGNGINDNDWAVAQSTEIVLRKNSSKAEAVLNSFSSNDRVSSVANIPAGPCTMALSYPTNGGSDLGVFLDGIGAYVTPTGTYGGATQEFCIYGDQYNENAYSWKNAHSQVMIFRSGLSADHISLLNDDPYGALQPRSAKIYSLPGAVSYQKSGDGATTPAGVLALRLLAYRLPAGQVSPVGELSRYASMHRPAAGEITPTGDPGPKFSFRRAIDGVSSFVGSIARDASFRKAIDGVLSYLGDILKQKGAFRAVDGTIFPVGTLTKLRGITGRIQDGIISFAGALSYTSKGIYQKAVSGVLALAGEVARTGTIHRIIDGELGQTGDTSRLASFRRETTGVLGMDGALGRVVGFLKAIVGVLSFSGETTEDYTQALSNSITSELSFAGPLASKAVFYRQVEGTISQAGDTERTDGWFARSNTGVLSFRASVPSPGGGAKARGLNKLGGMINLR